MVRTDEGVIYKATIGPICARGEEGGVFVAWGVALFYRGGIINNFFSIFVHFWIFASDTAIINDVSVTIGGQSVWLINCWSDIRFYRILSTRLFLTEPVRVCVWELLESLTFHWRSISFVTIKENTGWNYTVLLSSRSLLSFLSYSELENYKSVFITQHISNSWHYFFLLRILYWLVLHGYFYSLKKQLAVGQSHDFCSAHEESIQGLWIFVRTMYIAPQNGNAHQDTDLKIKILIAPGFIASGLQKWRTSAFFVQKDTFRQEPNGFG